MTGEDFIYESSWLSSHGMMMSSPEESATFSTREVLRSEFTSLRSIPDHYGTSYAEPQVFYFRILKKAGICGGDQDDLRMTGAEIHEIRSWLESPKKPAALIITEEEEVLPESYTTYYGLFTSVQPYTEDDECFGLDLEFTCDSPYGYSAEHTTNISFTNGWGQGTFTNLSCEREECLYPIITVYSSSKFGSNEHINIRNATDIGTTNNLVTVSEFDRSTMVSEPGYETVIVDESVCKKYETQSNLALSEVYADNDLKNSDEIYYSITIKADVESSTDYALSLEAYSGFAQSPTLVCSETVSLNITTVWKTISGTFTLSDEEWSNARFYTISIIDSSEDKHQLYFKRAIVRKKVNEDNDRMSFILPEGLRELIIDCRKKIVTDENGNLIPLSDIGIATPVANNYSFLSADAFFMYWLALYYGENVINCSTQKTKSNMTLGKTWEKGSLSTEGAETSDSTRIRSERIDLAGVAQVSLSAQDGYKYRIFYFDESGFISMSEFYTGQVRLMQSDWSNATYFRIVVATTDDSSEITTVDNNKLIVENCSVDRIEIKARYYMKNGGYQ